MLLRNHGTLSLGKTAADCWTGMFYLERACKMQIMALSAGRENVLMSPKPAREEVQGQTRGGVGGGLAWPEGESSCASWNVRARGYDA